MKVYRDEKGWREVNPHRMYITPSYDWAQFEQSIQYHPFPSPPDVELGVVVMAELMWQHPNNFGGYTYMEQMTGYAGEELVWVLSEQETEDHEGHEFAKDFTAFLEKYPEKEQEAKEELLITTNSVKISSSEEEGKQPFTCDKKPRCKKQCVHCAVFYDELSKPSHTQEPKVQQQGEIMPVDQYQKQNCYSLRDKHGDALKNGFVVNKHWFLTIEEAEKYLKHQSPIQQQFSQEYLKELAKKFEHLPKEMLEDLTSDDGVQQQAGEVSAEEVLDSISPNRPWRPGEKTDAMIIRAMREYAVLQTSALKERIKQLEFACDIDTARCDLLKRRVAQLEALNRKHETQLIGIGQFCAAEKIKRPELSELLDKIIDGKY